VIFGGGITIENAGFDEFESATKSRFSIQRWYHFGSTNFGSYLFGSSAIAINHPKPERVCKSAARPAVAPYHVLASRCPNRHLPAE
jgi:hypothetical protein